jgi:enoyl-CoA hydratase
VSPDELLNKAIALLSVINSKAPLAIAACIKTANAVYDETMDGYLTEINGIWKMFCYR